MKIASFLRPIIWIGLPVAAAVLFVLWPAIGQQPTQAPNFPTGTMSIRRADGAVLPFSVEIAATPEQDTYGLMFRKSLAPDHGMLFLANEEKSQAMWMKNTYIPLDMLYVVNDGTIVQIVEMAKPFDLTPLPSIRPVRAVIELKGGVTAADGIKTGDKVIYPAFAPVP